jgi:hypothetical protein
MEELALKAKRRWRADFEFNVKYKRFLNTLSKGD